MQLFYKVIFGLLLAALMLSADGLAQEKYQQKTTGVIKTAESVQSETSACQSQQKEARAKLSCSKAPENQPPKAIGANIHFTVNGKPFVSAIKGPTHSGGQ